MSLSDPRMRPDYGDETPIGHRVPNTCRSQGSRRSLRILWYLALPLHSAKGRPVLSPNGSPPLPSASSLSQSLKAQPGGPNTE